MAGIRENIGKPILAAIAPRFLIGMGKVLTFGMKKYTRNNWMRGLSWSETLDSLMRHTAALQAGEDVDAETGLLHTYHIAVNAMFLSHFQEYPELYGEYDDRPYTDDGVRKARTGV